MKGESDDGLEVRSQKQSKPLCLYLFSHIFNLHFHFHFHFHFLLPCPLYSLVSQRANLLVLLSIFFSPRCNSSRLPKSVFPALVGCWCFFIFFFALFVRALFCSSRRFASFVLCSLFCGHLCVFWCGDLSFFPYCLRLSFCGLEPVLVSSSAKN